MNVHDSIECDCGEDLVPLFMPFSGEINYICEILPGIQVVGLLYHPFGPH